MIQVEEEQEDFGEGQRRERKMRIDAMKRGGAAKRNLLNGDRQDKVRCRVRVDCGTWHQAVMWRLESVDE